jgi:malate synthase
MDDVRRIEPDRVTRAGLAVDHALAAFIETEALPGTAVAADRFWTGLSGLIAHFTPRLRALLAERDRLQEQIDAWHRARHREGRAGAPDPDEEIAFLRGIGYLRDAPDDVRVETAEIDDEIARLAGPQLVR